jgi:hypothetical protein
VTAHQKRRALKRRVTMRWVMTMSWVVMRGVNKRWVEV